MLGHCWQQDSRKSRIARDCAESGGCKGHNAVWDSRCSSASRASRAPEVKLATERMATSSRKALQHCLGP